MGEGTLIEIYIGGSANISILLTRLISESRPFAPDRINCAEEGVRGRGARPPQRGRDLVGSPLQGAVWHPWPGQAGRPGPGRAARAGQRAGRLRGLGLCLGDAIPRGLNEK